MPKHMVELLEALVPFLLRLQGPLPAHRPQDDDIVRVGLDTDPVILGGGLPALPERAVRLCRPTVYAIQFNE